MLAAEAGRRAPPGACVRRHDPSFAGSMAIAAQTEPPRTGSARGEGQRPVALRRLRPGGFLVASEIYGLVGQTERYLRLDGAAWTATASTAPCCGLSGTGAGRSPRWSGGRCRPAGAGHRARADGRGHHAVTWPAAASSTTWTRRSPRRRRRSAGRLRGRIVTSGERPDRASRCRGVAAPKLRTGRGLRRGHRDRSGRRAGHRRRGRRGRRPRDRPAVGEPARGRGDAGDRVVGVGAAARHGRHPGGGDQPVGVDHGHQPRRRHGPRARRARCSRIVNRRDSDLAHKSDGVLYTSDGRDVELAVASTKAFYAQVAAGRCSAVELGRLVGRLTPASEDSAAEALTGMPGQLADPARQEPTHRPDRARSAPRLPELGGGRVGAQPGGGRRDPDQAVRAVLQDHLHRRGGGQEAHRPLGRGVHPRLRRRRRRRPGRATWPRRSRSSPRTATRR